MITTLSSTSFMGIKSTFTLVHRCRPGGSMRACHAASPGSIPGRDKFRGRGSSGFFLTCKTKCREALGPQGPRISFGHHYHSLFITGANDLRCWRALKPQIYIQHLLRSRRFVHTKINIWTLLSNQTRLASISR